MGYTIFIFISKNMEYKYQVWADGSWYDGEWRNDEREGYGEMYWTDGSVYKGEWQVDKVEGCREVSIWIFILNKRILA